MRDGELCEKHAYWSGERLDGDPALLRISSWQDASVTAHRFDRLVVSVAPALLQGRRCYDDLRLEWTDWRALLADLRGRSGVFAVELDTPAGRGVTLIAGGRQLVTYTDAHPVLGDAALLDALAANGEGSVRVHREQGGGSIVLPEAPDRAPSAAAVMEETGDAETGDAAAPPAASDAPDPEVADPELTEPAAEEAAELVALAVEPERADPAAEGIGARVPPPASRSRRHGWHDLWWRYRGRQLTLVAGCILVLTGLGLTAPALIQQATVQQAVAARGANDVSAVNRWLSGSASPGLSSADAVTGTTTTTCGGASSEFDAYALVEFGGLSQYGYVGVAVNGNWTQLDDRSMVHWYGSPAPGGDGNMIIAFHREPDYQHIDQLGVGETVTVEDRSCQVYVYTITQRWELAPSAVTQLNPTGGRELTLITCTPWWQDYDRLVWRADLTSIDGVAVSPS